MPLFLRSVVAWIFMLSALGLAQDLDPFDPEPTVSSGRHTGSRILSHERRSIVLLSPSESERYTGMRGGYALANITHEGQFAIGWIPRDAVEDVIFQLEYFPAVIPAGHALLRFKLKRGYPVRLFQQPGNRPPEQGLLHDLVFSAEAVTIEGGPEYDVFRGLNRNYGFAIRFVSLEDKYESMVRKQKHRVRQFVLKLTAEQKQALLHGAIRRSHLAGMSELYNTLSNSCTTEAFNLIDRSLGLEPWTSIASLLDRMPTAASAYLRWRGLLDTREWPDLDEEWAVRTASGSCELELETLEDPA